MSEGTRSYQVGNLGDQAVVMQGEHLSLYQEINTSPLEEYLTRVVAAYEARMYAVLRMPSPPAYPYKFLYPFGLEDEPIFFGREASTKELYNVILRDRLTVLYGKSGAGKTSLLNAGLSPYLIRQGRLPLYVRVYADPVLAIKQTIASTGRWPKLLHDLPLHEFLGLVCERLGRQTQELIIVLDQFEEFFLKWKQPEARRAFIEALGTCYVAQGLPLRFIIALRKDYYAELLDFEDDPPHLPVSRNRYQLNPMNPKEVQEAITKPLAQPGISVTYESTLLEKLVADLALSEMELPLLQIMCTRLYETRGGDETRITLKAYGALGQVQGVLSQYLEGVLADLGKEEVLARNVLRELIRSDGMRQVLSHKAVAARVEVQRDELDRVLDRLVNARLLRRDEKGGSITYELVHDYLSREIAKWISLADQVFKQAEELLQRELVNWLVHRVHIPRNRLEVLYPYRERFKGVDTEVWRCLISSALAEDFAVADWAKTAGAIGELVLFQALKTADAEIRRRAVKTLKELSTPRAVEPLIAALKDEDLEVRRLAAQALGTIGDPGVKPLIATLNDENVEVRRLAAQALGEIGDPRAVVPLIVVLKDQDPGVRGMAVQAQGMIGDRRAVVPLIVALNDEDQRAQKRLAQKLGMIGDPLMAEQYSGLLKAKAKVRVWAQALETIGDPDVEPLIATLNDENVEVREWTAQALRKIGTPEAVSALESARKENMDEDH